MKIVIKILCLAFFWLWSLVPSYSWEGWYKTTVIHESSGERFRGMSKTKNKAIIDAIEKCKFHHKTSKTECNLTQIKFNNKTQDFLNHEPNDDLTVSNPSKKSVTYQTVTKTEPVKDFSKSSHSFRIKRAYTASRDWDFAKYLKFVLEDSLKNCEWKKQDYHGVCKVVSIKYTEFLNPLNNSMISNTDGITIENISINWDGIHDKDISIVKRPKKISNDIADKPKKKKPKVVPNDDKIVPAGSGSGFFVSSNGTIITNYHVIEGCNLNKVSHKGSQYEAKVLAVDKVNDIAILKTNITPERVFSVSNEDVSLLEDVVVAGYPLGKQVSSAIKTHKGVVTALAGVGDNYSNFQTDASINQGNSGGPILDQKGNVVGIAVATWVEEGVQGVHFGIKSSTLKTFASANGLKFLPANNRDLSNKDLGKLIMQSTVYVECHMTIAKIKKMIAEAENKKAFFKEFE